MKRFLTLILIVIILAALILAGGWYMSRKNAVKNNETAPTFREFLNFGRKETPTVPGSSSELTPDFVNPSTTPTSPDGGIVDDRSPRSSQFTSGPIAPSQSNLSQTTSNPSGSTGQNPGTSPQNPPVTTTVGTIGTSTQCTEDDVTITFTPDEIRALNRLQNRFYAVAGALKTDADVENELANYDEFKSKADQIIELNNYCQAKSPLIQAPAYRTRITTPYWRDVARDGQGYMAGRPAGYSWVSLNSQLWNPSNVSVTQGIIEQIFSVNLW